MPSTRATTGLPGGSGWRRRWRPGSAGGRHAGSAASARGRAAHTSRAPRQAARRCKHRNSLIEGDARPSAQKRGLAHQCISSVDRQGYARALCRECVCASRIDTSDQPAYLSFGRRATHVLPSVPVIRGSHARRPSQAAVRLRQRPLRQVPEADRLGRSTRSSPQLEALSRRRAAGAHRCASGSGWPRATELDDLLVDAFATVREAAKRTLGQRHFDVQLMGGVVLHRGMIAEMKTGEGKTLVATLPVYLNALTGKGVHVVTVNDYLARRDAEWMGQIYRFLGLTRRLHRPRPRRHRSAKRPIPATSPTAPTTSSASTICATT